MFFEKFNISFGAIMYGAVVPFLSTEQFAVIIMTVWRCLPKNFLIKRKILNKKVRNTFFSKN